MFLILPAAGFNRCSQNGQEFPAVSFQRLRKAVGEKAAAVEQLLPVQGFCGFFFCDLEFGNKVLSAAAIKRFCDVCTDACAASQHLLGKDIFLMLALQILIQPDDPNGKGSAFLLGNTFLCHRSS